jgi:hypothetical protein
LMRNGVECTLSIRRKIRWRYGFAETAEVDLTI